MQVDGLTLLAQLINFLILLWLLQRFLFGRIADAMARREQRLADRLDEAQRLQLGAEAEGKRYRQLEAELEGRRGQLLDEARRRAASLEAQLTATARRGIEAQEARWRQSVRQRQGDFLQRLRRQVAHGCLDLCRQVLADLAGIGLQGAATSRLVEHLGELVEADRQRLRQALEEAAGRVEVTTALPVAASGRQVVLGALQEIGPVTDVRWQERPDLALGFSIAVGSWLLSWNLESYLEELTHRVEAFLDEEHPTSTGLGGEGAEAEPSEATSSAATSSAARSSQVETSKPETSEAEAGNERSMEEPTE